MQWLRVQFQEIPKLTTHVVPPILLLAIRKPHFFQSKSPIFLGQNLVVIGGSPGTKLSEDIFSKLSTTRVFSSLPPSSRALERVSRCHPAAAAPRRRCAEAVQGQPLPVHGCRCIQAEFITQKCDENGWQSLEMLETPQKYREFNYQNRFRSKKMRNFAHKKCTQNQEWWIEGQQKMDVIAKPIQMGLSEMKRTNKLGLHPVKETMKRFGSSGCNVAKIKTESTVWASSYSHLQGACSKTKNLLQGFFKVHPSW